MMKTLKKIDHLIVGRCVWLSVSSLLLASPVWGVPEGLVTFEKYVRPALEKHCLECHSEKAGERRGGLLLDSRAGMLKGGDSGPALVPGDPEASLFIQTVEHTHEEIAMPPRKPKLGEATLHHFRHWVSEGAPDPRGGNALLAQPHTPVSSKKFWAFQPVVRSTAPEVENKAWPVKKLDRFVLAKLEQAGLSPSPEAPQQVLLRRLHFALTGLPPTRLDAARFDAKAKSVGFDRAYEAEVDRLLAADGFNIKWARHWLDVARYAESSGRESNLIFPHAWRFRDYVIDSFAKEMPFDRFILEQIAGDLLPYQDNRQRAQQLVATGFLAFGPKGLNEMNDDQFAADQVDEQIEATSRAFMAQSLACARCHDHKTDPYTMSDYYAMAGIFISSETHFGTWIDSENNVGSPLLSLPELPDQVVTNRSMSRVELKKLHDQLATLNAEEKAGRAELEAAVKEGRDTSGLFNIADALRIYWSRGRIEGQLMTVDESGKALPLAMGVIDRKRIEDAWLLDRGEVAKPLQVVKRQFPAALQVAGTAPPGNAGSGRLELAQWLAHPEHPLTSRVMVNRIWRWLFGEGLVRSVDDFGASGQVPSHPALLDELALDFVEDGWAIRHLVREIVLSRTWRQASYHQPDKYEADPDNVLLWRMAPARLTAEEIRDAMLTVSGELDTSRRVASPVAYLDNQSVSMFGFSKTLPKDLDGTVYRSIYLPAVRDRLPDILGLFDFAEPSMVTGDRDATNVPLQSLYLMNSDFVRDRAEAFASTLLRSNASRERKIALAFRASLGRLPSEEEQGVASRYLDDLAAEDVAMADAWSDFCQGLLMSAEFRNLD